MSTEVLAAPALNERITAFVRDFVRPNATAMARGEGPRPDDVVEAAGEAGLAGILTPVRFGGAGGSHRDFVDLIEAVAAADANMAVIIDVHASVGTEPIIDFGSDDQKLRYLPRLASGDLLAAFALTEPAGGSDAASLQTRAVRDGDGYIITGSKTFITSAGAADMYIVIARTGQQGTRGITAFLVESGWSGVSAGVPFQKLGLHGSLTGELVLDGVRVPSANRLGPEGAGFRVAMSALDSGRVGISAQAVGIAQGALDVAVAESRARLAAGAQVDEVTLADMEATTMAARALTRYTAALVDAGERATLDASVSKLYATDTCVAVAHAAVQLCAPASASQMHPATIRLRDAKASQIYEGTNQIQRLIIARELLG